MSDNAFFRSGGMNGEDLEPRSPEPASVVVRPRSVDAPAKSAGAAEDGELQIGASMLAALRGRLPMAIGLGLLVGAAAAFVSWRLVKPKYESEGLVRIRNSLPEVMSETDQNRAMPNFDTFMQSQKLLLTSRAVLDRALVDPVWRAMGQSTPAEPDRYFARNLRIEVKPHSEIIQIAVQDEDPRMAAAAVNSIISAYNERYRREDERLSTERNSFLEQRSQTTEQELDALQKQLDRATKEFGTAKLDPIYDSAAQRWTKAEEALSNLRLMIASIPVADGTDAGNAPAATRPVGEEVAKTPTAATKMAKEQVEFPDNPSTESALSSVKGDGDTAVTPEQLALSDPLMKEYVAALDRAERNLKQLRLKYGEGHPAVQMAKLDLDDATGKVESYATTARAFRAAVAARVSTGKPGKTPSADVLRKSVAAFETIRDKALADMKDYGEKRSRLEKLSADTAAKRSEFEKIQQRLGVIKSEALGGRLSVASTGEVAMTPVRETRLFIAPAAGAVGMCLPAGLMILGNFMSRRRYRFSDEADEHTPMRGQLLGILPTLAMNDMDGEAMASAAHNVHQIRVSLRAQQPNTGSNVYLVTSSAAGDGKTSLTMSLGYSYAASRARTLVIDCDLVGRHLSRNLQSTDTEGFNEALKSPRLKELIHKAGSNLYVMSAGLAGDIDACGVSPARVRSVLAEAKQYFEVILIDSGPILGSVEAAVLAQEVDGVIFTIARGQERSLVERSVRRITSLGARVEGFVFNRANSHDYLRSAYASSSRISAPAHGAARRIVNLDSKRMVGFGPIVQAVLASVPADFHGTAAE